MRNTAQLTEEAQRLKFAGKVAIEMSFDEFKLLDSNKKILSFRTPAMLCRPRTVNLFEGLTVIAKDKT